MSPQTSKSDAFRRKVQTQFYFLRIAGNLFIPHFVYSILRGAAFCDPSSDSIKPYFLLQYHPFNLYLYEFSIAVLSSVMLFIGLSTPFETNEILPVSSETTMALASVCSVIPTAALWRKPY